MFTRRRLLVLLSVAVIAGAVPPSARAYERNAELERVSAIFAMRPDEVRCPETEEWATFARDELSLDDADLLFGVTYLSEDWIMLRPDLCYAAAHVTDGSLRPEFRAAGVLALIHESYHVRRWAYRRDEARVECQAIRHFRVGARLLGASEWLADRLFRWAVVWHYGVSRPGTPYVSPWCQVPS